MNMPEENKINIYKSYMLKYSETSQNEESVEYYFEKMESILEHLENDSRINEDILDSLENLRLELKNGTLR
jgi:ribosomal protein S15P/S13E